MEDLLTTDELFELYGEITDRELREFKSRAKAQGAEVELELGAPSIESTNEPVDSAFQGIMDRIADRTGVNHMEEDPSREYRNMKMGYSRQ